MFPLEIPLGTTIDALIGRVMPDLHDRLVPDDAPNDLVTVVVRVHGAGSWTIRIRGREMLVNVGETSRPTLWLVTTARVVDRLLADATGERRVVPERISSSAVAMTDPRLIKRAALAEGRIELAVPDFEGERLAIVLGFGKAAIAPIDAESPDAIVEAPIETLRRALDGSLSPEEALSGGTLQIRGNRFLPMQLALAVAPLYRARK
ncbi:MAG: SCP2 sterol-binding domain-containing protein [Polyangiaceae bacterium]|jgi:hypothetical protein